MIGHLVSSQSRGTWRTWSTFTLTTDCPAIAFRRPVWPTTPLANAVRIAVCWSAISCSLASISERRCDALSGMTAESSNVSFNGNPSNFCNWAKRAGICWGSTGSSSDASRTGEQLSFKPQGQFLVPGSAIGFADDSPDSAFSNCWNSRTTSSSVGVAAMLQAECAFVCPVCGVGVWFGVAVGVAVGAALGFLRWSRGPRLCEPPKSRGP